MELIGEFTDDLFTIAENRTAAYADQRFMCMGQYVHNLANLKIIAFHCRFIATNADFIHRHIINLFLLNIQRHINQHRTAASRRCNVESFLENTWDLSGISDKITVFNKGFCRTSNICFLKYILAQQFT